MTTRLVSVVVDSADPALLGRWWAHTLGWTVTHESDDEVDVSPADRAHGSLELVFVPVAEARRGPNQVHLDLSSADHVDHARTVASLLASGARDVDLGQAPDAAFTVLADPEGNECCVLGPREVYRDTGPVAAVAVNSADPVAAGDFWSLASGWPVVRREDRFVGMRAPGGSGPYLELLPSAGAGLDPRPKDRVHLDGAPGAGDDQAGDTARLVAAGARPIDVGQLAPDGSRRPEVTWDVLVAPDGHEFCVLSSR